MVKSVESLEICKVFKYGTMFDIEVRLSVSYAQDDMFDIS